MLEDARPILAVQVGMPEAGNVVAVGESGLTAIMPYKEADGSMWLAMIGVPRNTIQPVRESVRARMSLRFVSNIVYADDALGGDDVGKRRSG